MKKVLAIILAAVMAVSFAACSANGGSNEGAQNEPAANTAAVNKVDLSAYPADINEWTVDNLMDYFTKAGCFKNEDWKYVQNEEECEPATLGLSKVGSYMSDDEDGNEVVFLFWFDPAASQAKVKEQFEYIKANKTFDEAFDMQPVDHVIGNFGVSYSLSIDDEFYNSMDAAYNQLVTDMGLTPAF